MSHSADTDRVWSNGGAAAATLVYADGDRPRVLIPPGEYAAIVTGVEGPLWMFGRQSIYVWLKLQGDVFVEEECDPACADYYTDAHGLEIYRPYSVHTVGGVVVVGAGADLANEWSRATGLQFPADGRVDLQALIGLTVRARVATVGRDRDKDPRPPQSRYSKAAKILEPGE